MDGTLALLTLGITLLCGVLAVAGVRTYLAGNERQAALVERLTDPGEPSRPAGRFRPLRRFDRAVRGTGLGRRLERRIAATGLSFAPGDFLLWTAAAAAALWVVAALALAPFFGPLAAVVAVWTAFALLGRQRRKRIEKFINQLPELARILANATQAGLALRTALGMAAEEMDAPAGEELAAVADRLAVGHSVDEALAELAERLPSRELGVLVTTLVLSHRSGGSVVRSLRNLTETLEERKETRREVRTQLSQVTATAYVVPLMGIGTLFLLDRIAPGSIDRMTGTALGQLTVIGAFALYGVGFFLIRRMSRVDI
ncbi:type II secretion system F family protein [Streptomyces huiliensis]|uniref:type II secretion system F family protein n=1 Tax=Streptomyces huiliensis TaxID=2876027 RepID=UPI001CBB2276|nr:type II secretion system F family protein [Streptomyces huiliensis]MBZ4318465.1 type II secretion system F family protein [Streptomyces huiliensis]